MGGHGKDRRQSRQADYDEDDHAAAASTRQPFCRDQGIFQTENLVAKFSGQDKSYSVAKWATDIDDNAEIFQWTPLQTLIVARRSLTGTAALWLKSEKPFKSWDELKAGLLKEFPDSIDSKTIHEMMAARKKKKDERCLDYLLVMKEMGKRGKMADYVAIKYIIDGIIDSEVNKMVLYGATTYTELKEKIKIYETIKEKMGASYVRNKKPESIESSAGTSNKRCYSCGERNHQSSQCPYKEKGLKCFKCNEFGHISTQCKQSGNVRSRTSEKNVEREWRSEKGKPNSSEDRRAMCVTDFTPSVYEVGNDDYVSHDSSFDRCTNISDKMANAVGTDANFTDVYDEIKTPAQIRFENACKTIFINKCEVTALIDSGSELNLMCTELYVHLGSPECVKTATNLVGLGGSIVSTKKLTASVLLDGHDYNATFYVVPRHAMPCSVILGQDFLKDVFTIMSKGSILIAPNINNWLSKVCCVVSQDQSFVLGNIKNKQVRQDVIDCVKNYNPKQVKEAPIELRIVLKDDIPVAQRPRRISLAEQQMVEKQVAEWLKEGIIREWNDYKLKWNPDDYGGVETLHVPSEHIWLPDIVLYNNADGNYEVTIMTKAILHHDGKVVWKPPAIYKSFCEIDVEYFPFDEQTCFMKFGSWSYDGYMVDLRHLKQTPDSDRIGMGIDLSEYYISVEWDIMRVPATRNEKFYSCCEEPYPDIIFNITLRRKTLFYTVNLIIPCVGISFLSVLVFYLPSDSGEKISLCISILLSLTVFFLLLAEIIPPTSLTVPLLGKYLLFTMMLVTLSVVVTIVVLNINFRSPVTHHMAPWVRKVFIDFLPKILCIQRPEKPPDDDDDNDKPSEILTDVFGPDDMDGKFKEWGCEEYELPGMPPSPPPPPGGDDELFSPPPGSPCRLDLDDGSPSLEKPYVREMEKTIEGSRFIAQHVKNKDKFESVEDDWKYVAMVLDRIFLFLFTIACVLGTALIIFRAPTFYDNTKPIDILYSKIAKKKLELLKMGSEGDPGL